MKYLSVALMASCLMGCQIEKSTVELPSSDPIERRDQVPEFDPNPNSEPDTICGKSSLDFHGIPVPVECNPFYFEKGRPPENLSPANKPVMNPVIKMFATQGSMC